MELSLFCFQWIVSFWSLTLLLGLYQALRNRNHDWTWLTNLAYVIVALSSFSAFGFLYYRNLIVLLQARDLNINLKIAEIEAPAESGFILIAYFLLLWCANFSWFVMNFFVGILSAGAFTDCMRRRRHRRLSQEERSHNTETRRTFLDGLKE